MRYLYQAQSDLEVVVCEDDGAIVDAIDERTLLVPISHVLFRSGEIQDVEAITRRAHEVGARVVLDCYQSAGIVPFSVAALGVDFAVGGSVKWLCGGPGNGWLYVRPDLIEQLEPTFMGWQAHESPFAFEPELRYAPGVARFLTGTPNVPALYAATAGYDLVEEVGVERIRENSLVQTDLLIRLADEAGFEVRSPRDPARRGGTVTVHVPDFEAVHKELARAAGAVRLPAGRRHPARAALLQHERGARAGRRDDRRDPRDRRPRALAGGDGSFLMSRALVIVDIQNDYFPGGAHPLVGPEAAAANAQQLLEAFRASGEPLFHVQHVWDAPDAAFMRPGTAGVEIHESVAPAAGEPVIQKANPNSFLDTPLEAELRARGVEHVVVCGMMTSMCVDATVRAAVDLGFEATVAHDACATCDLDVRRRDDPRAAGARRVPGCARRRLRGAQPPRPTCV